MRTIRLKKYEFEGDYTDDGMYVVVRLLQYQPPSPKYFITKIMQHPSKNMVGKYCWVTKEEDIVLPPYFSCPFGKASDIITVRYKDYTAQREISDISIHTLDFIADSPEKDALLYAAKKKGFDTNNCYVWCILLED